jgi:hypothetical protein
MVPKVVIENPILPGSRDGCLQIVALVYPDGGEEFRVLAPEKDNYKRPNFCHKCGHAYPWMEDRLKTAKELLNHDDKLSYDERENLWGLLQYVMSDPKSDLVPANKKLIEISLAKAAAATRDFVTSFMAQYFAEMSKS